MSDQLPLVTEIQRVTHVLGLQLEEALEDLDLSQGEIHVLSLLALPGRASVSELQRGVQHRTSTLTGIIDRLADKKLVSREINEADRRSFIIGLTRSGRLAARRVAAVMDDMERRVRREHSAVDVLALRRVLATLAPR